MGNCSSSPSHEQLKQIKNEKKQKKQLTKKKKPAFCCPCIVRSSSNSYSSSSLSIGENSLPTFDRLSSNGKQMLSSNIDQIDSTRSLPNGTPSISSHITADPLPNQMINGSSLSAVSTIGSNRRSVSLSNVITTLPDTPLVATPAADQLSIVTQEKPPLPPRATALPPIVPTSRSQHFGSFRLPLTNTKRTYFSQSIEHARVSIEDLEKSLHGAASIDQWIDSLPILGTPSLSRVKNNHHHPRTSASTNKKIKRSLTIGDEQTVLNGSYRQENNSSSTTIENNVPTLSEEDDNEQLPSILSIKSKSTREFFQLAKSIDWNLFHFHTYLKDFVRRLQNSKLTTTTRQTFKEHFSSSNTIYPCHNLLDQTLTDDLHVFIVCPPESILPNWCQTVQGTYKIREQIRAKCYFIPFSGAKIEPEDEEFKRKHIHLDRTHVVITLQNETNEAGTKKSVPIEPEPSCIFVPQDSSFHTGLIRVDNQTLIKHFLPFVHHSTNDDEQFYLSSSAIQQWFSTLMLVNQTCTIANRFLTGDGSYITCLLKQQTTSQSNSASPSQSNNSLTLAALRLPPCMFLGDPSQIITEEHQSNITDGFSSTFLSNNKKSSNDTIHIDYEQYSFGLLLVRWPKSLLDNYYAQTLRNTKRQWPSKYHMNIIIKKPLLLVPNFSNNGLSLLWQLNFDLVEQGLFEFMTESALFFYGTCLQLFANTRPTDEDDMAIRTCIKHCFLNYCEKYGLPFSTSTRQRTNDKSLLDLTYHFLKELHCQVNGNFIPHYFDSTYNVLQFVSSAQLWCEHLNYCLNDRSNWSTLILSSSRLQHYSHRPIIVEFLFYFIDQLYQTFHIKRSQFHLNDNVLLDLHRQLCDKLSNDTNNNSTNLKFINELLNTPTLIEHIQMNLTHDFEINAELVHTCLNQVRKAQSSLIFHYTWTIFVQYLHTYYNALWNI